MSFVDNEIKEKGKGEGWTLDLWVTLFALLYEYSRTTNDETLRNVCTKIVPTLDTRLITSDTLPSKLSLFSLHQG